MKTKNFEPLTLPQQVKTFVTETRIEGTTVVLFCRDRPSAVVLETALAKAMSER